MSCDKCYPDRCSCEEQDLEVPTSAVQPVATDDRLYTVFSMKTYTDASKNEIRGGFRVAAWVPPEVYEALKETFLEVVMDQEVVE